MTRGTSLAILAALAALVLADGVVSAAPRQQTPPSTDATLSSLTLSGVDINAYFRLRRVHYLHRHCGEHRYGNDGNGNSHQPQRHRGHHSQYAWTTRTAA